MTKSTYNYLPVTVQVTVDVYCLLRLKGKTIRRQSKPREPCSSDQIVTVGHCPTPKLQTAKIFYLAS